MATVTKTRRLVNPGRRRKLSPLQKLFFGSKRQRAVMKRRGGRRNPPRGSRKFSVAKLASYKKATRLLRRHGIRTARPKRKRNVGSILTVFPAGVSGNPGSRHSRRKRVTARRHANRGKRVVVINPFSMKGVFSKMAAHRRKRRSNEPGPRRHRRYRRHNPATSHRVYHRRRTHRRNPPYIKQVRRGRYLYGNPRRRRYHRNPGGEGEKRVGGMFGGTATKVLAIIGGATVTKLVSDFLPASLQTGILGYFSIGIVAVAQGKLIGKVAKSSTVGDNMVVGGLVYLAIKVLNDFIPSISGTLGLRGMGIISPTQGFAVPLVNQPGSMGTFVRPGFVPAAYIPPAGAGMGALQSVRRGGRVR